MKVKNLFHRDWEPREHRIAARLLTGETASFDDLSMAAGTEGGRVAQTAVAMAIAMIEDQCGVVVKKRTADYGMLYRYVDDAEYEPERALTDPRGKRYSTSDQARMWRGKIVSSGAPRRF